VNSWNSASIAKFLARAARPISAHVLFTPVDRRKPFRVFTGPPAPTLTLAAVETGRGCLFLRSSRRVRHRQVDPAARPPPADPGSAGVETDVDTSDRVTSTIGRLAGDRHRPRKIDAGLQREIHDPRSGSMMRGDVGDATRC